MAVIPSGRAFDPPQETKIAVILSEAKDLKFRSETN